MAIIVSSSKDGAVIRFGDTVATSVNRMKLLNSSDWTRGCVNTARSHNSVSNVEGSCSGFPGIYDEFTKDGTGLLNISSGGSSIQIIY